MKRFCVLVSGGGTDLQSIIDAAESGMIHAEICGVISSKQGAYALERAAKHGIDGFTVARKGKTQPQFDDELRRTIDALQPDFIVLAGFLSILSSELVKAYENRIINIHPALIPSFCGGGYYGLKVHQAAIDYGVKLSGATVHFVDEGTDTGAIILQEAVPVLPNDTAESLQERVLQVEHIILPQAVALMADGRLEIHGRTVNILEV